MAALNGENPTGGRGGGHGSASGFVRLCRATGGRRDQGCVPGSTMSSTAGAAARAGPWAAQGPPANTARRRGPRGPGGAGATGEQPWGKLYRLVRTREGRARLLGSSLGLGGARGRAAELVEQAVAGVGDLVDKVPAARLGALHPGRAQRTPFRVHGHLLEQDLADGGVGEQPGEALGVQQGRPKSRLGSQSFTSRWRQVLSLLHWLPEPASAMRVMRCRWACRACRRGWPPGVPGSRWVRASSCWLARPDEASRVLRMPSRVPFMAMRD